MCVSACVCSQLKEVGPRVTKLDDPVLLTAFNKLSDTVAKDQVGGLCAFTVRDRRYRMQAPMGA